MIDGARCPGTSRLGLAQEERPQQRSSGPGLLRLLSGAPSCSPARPTNPAGVDALVRAGAISRPADAAGSSVHTEGRGAEAEAKAEPLEECPVCCAFFPASQLQAHVEAELDALDASERGVPGSAASHPTRPGNAQQNPGTACPLCGQVVPPHARAAHMEAELAPLRAAAQEAAALVESAHAKLVVAGFAPDGARASDKPVRPEETVGPPRREHDKLRAPASTGAAPGGEGAPLAVRLLGSLDTMISGCSQSSRLHPPPPPRPPR